MNPGGIEAAAGHAPVVLIAAAIAALAAYVAFDLAERSRQCVDRFGSRMWTFAGAAALGTGLWSMHFVGMSAVDYPFKAGFEFGATFLSWAMAVAVCLIPVGLLASSARGDPIAMWACACATGAGAVAMHLVGASAMATSPEPAYDLTWLAAALACAVVGAGFALRLAERGADRWRTKARSAALAGGSLAAMHFLAMASSTFAPGAVCLSQDGIEAHALSRIVGAVTLAFLGMMLLVSVLEKRAQRMSSAMQRSLALAQAEIQRVSLNDSATGLPNRLVFQQALDRAAARSAESGGGFAVLIVGIDGFGRFRRALSADSADAALRACSQRIAAAAGPSCLVASAGGQELLALAELPNAGDSDAALELAARIASEMKAPFDQAGRLTASIGISIHPADGAVDRIVGNASVAMEAVRERGGNGYAFFEPGLDVDAQAATELVDDLRLAVERGELTLHYQPKVHAASGQIAGAEALLRWRHPVRGMVGPDKFIPLAERFGLINELGDWVVADAVRQMAEWADQGVRLRVAVNVSPGQLLQPGFADRVVATLGRAGVAADLLTCEITESGAMQDAAATMATFERLESAGVRLSIDDFGTGFSSLSHLRKIPLSQLKVDRSFVNDLQSSPDARSIASAIIGMAHALRLEVVAEGVETTEQRDILLAMGCDKFQGYLFAKPMPARELTELMLGIDAMQRQFRDSIFVS